MQSVGNSAQQLRRLARRDYERNADELARFLIGSVLVRNTNGCQLRARIIETEAYLGPDDLASHASKGRTRRTEVMFGPAGRAYVYLIYGMHDMFNVVCGSTGSAHAVLIRAAQPLNGWSANLSGPGRLARGMQITRSDNGVDLCDNPIFFERDPQSRPSVQTTPRIGIDYAGNWRDAPLRFVELASDRLERPRFKNRTRLPRPASMR